LRPLDKLSSGKSSDSMGRVVVDKELKLSFEQASQEVMVVEGIGTSSVCPRGTSLDLSTRISYYIVLGSLS